MKKNTLRLTLRGKVVMAIVAAITAMAVGYGSFMLLIKAVDEVIAYQDTGAAYAHECAEARFQAEGGER